MDAKIGAYFCNGCEIGKSLEMEKLEEIANNDPNTPICKRHDILCSPEGIELIKKDIEAEGLNRIAVCACSIRSFPELFDFGKEVLTERVNLREYVVWSHEPNDEDTQMLAEDYLRMGLTKLNTIALPEPLIEETSKEIMVIGGGMSGMTAAKAAADSGYKVSLVEKEDKLGGWATKFKKVFPKKSPYQELEDSNVGQLISEVEANENITVYKSAEIEKTSGQPGQFQVSLQNGSKTELSIGSIVLATGWKPYEADKLTHLGYGSSKNIVTNIDMEEMAMKGEIKCPEDGKEPESIAFIQCAGSRDQDHLPYCSAVCCRVSLKQAMYVREQYPNAKIYVIYKDLRSPQQYEMFYAHVQKDDGIFLTKGEIAKIEPNNGKISIEVEETLLGEDIIIETDMVVLATGMVPTTKVEDVSSEPEVDVENGEKPAEAETEDGKKAAEAAEPGAKIINLTYRQGTDLPTHKYGFPDSHFVCFPYETKRTAIYATGVVRAPMDFSASINDAYGAAMKSIQAVESTANGVTLHPRVGDITYPDFFLQKCTQCKRCTEECPFGTLDEDDKGTPKLNPFRCRRCGICLGACPERIISFKNYSVNMVSQMIKAIDVPDEFEEKPRILAFICENDALPSVDMAGLKRMKYNAMLRIIPLRCLGSMNSVWISDALASGFDGVILIGCKKGDDYQCHFVRGSELASTRMANVRDKLQQLVLEEERVEIHELALSDYYKIPKIFDDFLEVIETVGPNPYKDM